MISIEAGSKIGMSIESTLTEVAMWPFKSSAQKVSDFKATRIPQGFDEFVQACNLPAGTRSTFVALGVRAAIAELGHVESAFIRADDRFEDELINLPFWGSLDTMGVVLALEAHLGIRISDDEAQHIRNPEISKGMTVADFVGDTFKVVADKVIT